MAEAGRVPPIIAYVSCAESKEIHSFRLDPATGALEALEVVAVPGTAEPSPSNMPLALSPKGDRLYAALRSPPFPVASFAIDPASGGLQHRATAPLPAPMAYIATDRTGRLLMSASYKEGKLAVSRIDDVGAVQAPALSVLATPPKAHCIIAGRSGGMVYATTVEGNAILLFRLDLESGLLTPADPPAMPCRAGAGPRHITLHPRLDVLYCVNELGGTLATFAIDPGTGALTELQYESLVPAGFQGNARAADLHLTPDGRFAYASVRNTHAIAGFAVDARSGRLTPIGRFDAEPSPRGFGLDPQGRFLLCAGQNTNMVRVHAIDPVNGALSAGTPYPVGRNPSWVEILALTAPP